MQSTFMHAELLPPDFDERASAFADAAEQQLTPEKRKPGRPPGSKNKPKLETAEDVLLDMGTNPIRRMLLIADAAEQQGKPALALKALSEIAQYSHAKKKSIEHTIPDDGPAAMALRLSSAERMLRITELMQKLGKLGVDPNAAPLPPPES